MPSKSNQVKSNRKKTMIAVVADNPKGGGGVSPLYELISMCRPKGYGF